jgi:hypothetical protein
MQIGTRINELGPLHMSNFMIIIQTIIIHTKQKLLKTQGMLNDSLFTSFLFLNSLLFRLQSLWARWSSSCLAEWL